MAALFWTFVDPSQVQGGLVTIRGAQGHHLGRVLRVRAGERGVAVANGREYEVEVVEVRGAHVLGRIMSDRPVRGEPDVAVTLLQAVLPNPDFDAVIEGGTGVGVRRFLAVQAQRSIARPPAARLARWQSIADSAAEQSHRGEVPEVSGPMSLSAALDQVIDSTLLVLDPSASTPMIRASAGSRAYTLAVGPEGGWTGEEFSLLTDRGGVPVTLGPRILRARLAPIVAAAILVQHP